MDFSFKNYIKSKYYDYIYNKLRFYIFNHKDSIPFRLEYIDNVNQVWLEEADIKKFYIHEYSNNEIGINIIIEAYVTLKEYSKGVYKSDSDYPWFLINCKCELKDELKNFRILNIEPYEGLYERSQGLTDNLIPYIKKDNMDEYATRLLKEYYPEALNDTILDPYDFANRLGLTIKKVDFKNPNQMGSIYFDDYKIKIKDKVKITPGKTVLISKALDSKRSNFTIMHECVHYMVHKRAFELEKLYNKSAKHISCNGDGSGVTSAKSSSLDWMEWQANNLAPRLLMPKQPFLKNVNQLLTYYNIRFNDTDYLEDYENIILELSNIYNVSQEVIKIRLVELGYEFPIGCLIYTDGKRIMPHAFAKGALGKYETYSVGERDAAIYSFQEKYGRKNDQIDNYIYVKSHLCLNDPRYIKNEDGNVDLTDYARHHMDECCIKFEVDLANPTVNGEIDYKTIEVLNRRKNDSEIVIKAYNDFKVAAAYNVKAMNNAFLKETQLLNGLPRTTKGLFKILKVYSGYTILELADGTLIDEKTIEKYLYDNVDRYTLDKVVRLLLFMNVPPKVSLEVLTMCNCSLNLNNQEHQWIDYVLRNRWTYKFEDNIEFLVDMKIYI